MEIERRFMISNLPNYPISKISDNRRVYISTDPEVRLTKTRVIIGDNKGEDKYILTVKGDGDIAREEFETYVSKEFFNNIVFFLKQECIHKINYYYKFNGNEIRCSVVDAGTKFSYMYAEVEFETIEEAEAFKWPFLDVHIEDVTYDKSYLMKNYWKRKNHISE